MKKGFPEPEELVICTVTNIQSHCAFVQMDEYGRSGMIHISEISTGRVRNIKEYVTEKKKIICKVLKIDRERGYIDLSLRRVNEAQRKAKLNLIKQETLSENIVDYVTKKTKTDKLKVFEQLSKASEPFGSVFALFEAVASDQYDLKEAKLDPAVATELSTAVKTRIKAPEVILKGDLHVYSFEPNGVELIAEAFKGAKTEKSTMVYVGGGSYHIVVNSKDYKSGEAILGKIVDGITNFMKKHRGFAEFTRAQ